MFHLTNLLARVGHDVPTLSARRIHRIQLNRADVMPPAIHYCRSVIHHPVKSVLRQADHTGFLAHCSGSRQLRYNQPWRHDGYRSSWYRSQYLVMAEDAPAPA